MQDPPRHPVGLPLGPDGGRCGTCAWRRAWGAGSRCRQANVRVDPLWAACERFEPETIDCQECGACCREAYDSVTIGPREPVIRKHPELIVRRPGYVELLRRGHRCAALEGEAGVPGGRCACVIYEDRPRPCRDFARRGEHCLVARRRVGLSR